MIYQHSSEPKFKSLSVRCGRTRSWGKFATENFSRRIFRQWPRGMNYAFRYRGNVDNNLSARVPAGCRASPYVSANNLAFQPRRRAKVSLLGRNDFSSICNYARDSHSTRRRGEERLTDGGTWPDSANIAVSAVRASRLFSLGRTNNSTRFPFGEFLSLT